MTIYLDFFLRPMGSGGDNLKSGCITHTPSEASEATIRLSGLPRRLPGEEKE